jgi:Lrp/AsnC family leucine-responsive transcriptional regulator
VHERVKKLEARGVVRGYHAHLDPERLGFDVLAFVSVVQDLAGDWEAVAEAFAAVPEILECHHVAGAEDFLLKVRARDTRDLERVLNRIQACRHVVTTRTVVALSSPFTGRSLPVEARASGPPETERGPGA